MLAAFAACAASVEEPFIYRAERGDTLIGIGNRLLAVPAQWRGVQRLNRIDDPHRIPVGKEIRIPVAWLRRVPESARILTVRGQAERGRQRGPGPAPLELQRARAC